MREKLEYTTVPGSKKEKHVRVFALSTCGFCKRGIEFLTNNSIDFEYIYIDLMPLEEKRALKDELYDAFNKRVAFPFMVIDDAESHVGFIEDDWKKALGV